MLGVYRGRVRLAKVVELVAHRGLAFFGFGCQTQKISSCRMQLNLKLIIAFRRSYCTLRHNHTQPPVSRSVNPTAGRFAAWSYAVT